MNADALQAQNKDSQGTLNFYGLFYINKNPTYTRTLTYQKTNNDTIVNLNIDAVTSRINSSFLSVKGIKLPIVMKFDYINDADLYLSFYQYDWTNNTSEIIFSTHINTENGTQNKKSFYSKKDFSYNYFLGSLWLGFHIAEASALALGGWSVAAQLSAAELPILAAALGVSSVVVATGVAIVITLAIINSNANASELIPTDLSPPANTPMLNPVPQSLDPTPHLEKTSCYNNNITFNGSMDSFGNIAIAGVNGGTPPYVYMVDGVGLEPITQASPIFLNQYKSDTYILGVKDATGCMSVKGLLLKREGEVDSFTGTSWSLISYDGGKNLGECGYLDNDNYCTSIFSADISFTLTTFSITMNASEKNLSTGDVEDISGTESGSRNGLTLSGIDENGETTTTMISIITSNKISIDGMVFVKK